MAVIRRSRLAELADAPLVRSEDGSWRVLTEGLPFSDSSDAGADYSLSANQRLPRVLPLIQQSSARGVGAPRVLRRSEYRRFRAPAIKYPPANSGFWKEFNKLREYAPRRVWHCVKRKVRKEVLFARKVAGRKRSPGRGGGYRRTVYSQWSC